jgi:COP9 signalosome complex subunit 2
MADDDDDYGMMDDVRSSAAVSTRDACAHTVRPPAAQTEDYGFTYEDDDDDSPDVSIENRSVLRSLPALASCCCSPRRVGRTWSRYYQSKALKEDSLEGALDSFASVLELEEKPGEWGFKALKQMVKIYYELGRYEDMMSSYVQVRC